jgi:uncharacterized protein
MTQLGCNYSPALLELLRAGEVDVDWIKLSLEPALEDEIALCRPFRPCLVHTLPRAGLAPAQFEAVDWARLSHAIVAAGSPHVAMHLEVRKSDRTTEDLIARMVRQMGVAAARLPVPLLGENVVYRKGSEILGMSAETDVIRTVLRQANMGLLLDTAHLRCSAHNQGRDVREYALALPLETVREIHVAGIRRKSDGQLNDSHGEIDEADYELLAWLLERTQPQMVTLEYGGTGPVYERPGMSDPDALRRQLARLKEMLS